MANKSTKYNQMRGLMAITKASIISTFRNPSSIVFGLVFPLVFILVFGFIGNGSVEMSVGVYQDSDRSNQVYEALEQIENITLITDKTDQEIENDLKKGTIAATIYIEDTKMPAPSFSVDVKTSEAAPDVGGLFLSILNGISNQATIQAAGIQTPAIAVNSEVVPGREYKSIDFILPGQLGFSLLSTGIFATAFVFVILKQTLVIKRFFATPINRAYIVIGEGLSRLVFSALQAIVIILTGKFLFGFTLVNGVETFLVMLLLSSLGLIVFLGFGFVVSSIAKNENAVPPIANLITLPQFLLAGTFFPVETFPEWLQPVSRILPLTYLNDAMRKVAFEGASLDQVGKEILILFIWGIIIYALAIKLFKWE